MLASHAPVMARLRLVKSDGQIYKPPVFRWWLKRTASTALGTWRRWSALILGLSVALCSTWALISASPFPPLETIRHLAAAPNCAAARSVGLAPARRGQPGYYPSHDADNDGIACEPYRGR